MNDFKYIEKILHKDNLTNEVIKKIARKDYLTKDEIRIVLNYLITTTRTNLNIDKYDSVKCVESSIFLDRLCEIIDIPYIKFSNNELGMRELEHHYGILGLNTEIDQVCFLLDATYMQFDKKTYTMSNKLIVSPGEFIDENLKQQLINNGFFTLTPENIYEYLNSFVQSYSSLYKIDKDLVFNKFYELLKEFNINVIDHDYLSNNLKQR